MFLICDENNFGNIQMCLAVARQSRTFQLLMLHGKLGGDTARTADPNWPKGYPMPYDTMLSI